MITTAVLEIIWAIIEGPLNSVPDIKINYEDLSNSTVYQYIQSALYLLPMDTVTAIFTITAALWVLRVFIAFFRALWAALPIV